MRGEPRLEWCGCQTCPSVVYWAGRVLALPVTGSISTSKKKSTSVLGNGKFSFKGPQAESVLAVGLLELKSFILPQLQQRQQKSPKNLVRQNYSFGFKTRWYMTIGIVSHHKGKSYPVHRGFPWFTHDSYLYLIRRTLSSSHGLLFYV